MSRIAAAILSLFGLLLSAPAAAQSFGMVAMPPVFVSKLVVQPTEGAKVLGPAPRKAMRHVSHGADFLNLRVRKAVQYSATPFLQALPRIDLRGRDYRRGIAYYGPFMVLDSRRVALVGETDRTTPEAFAAMLRDFPGLQQLDMVECPGTLDDLANMKLGRMIRAARMVTFVPSNGSVRSGAVELFLAGVSRHISEGAEFAVHSWVDDDGREASDFDANAPENRRYVEYYREMGMAPDQARAFYDFTNSVPHRSALWLNAFEMRRWILRAPVQTVERRPAQLHLAPVPEPAQMPERAPKLAYADVTFS